MKFLVKCIALLSVSSAMAVDYAPPTANQGWWTPHTAAGTAGVGVPGGIWQYLDGSGDPNERPTANLIDVTQAPYNADNTGATDSVTAIEAAIAAVTTEDGVYLPAGTYRIDDVLDVPSSFDNKTIRGAGSGSTFIKPTIPGSSGIMVIGIYNNSYEGGTYLPITGTVTKGTTTLTVSDSSGFTVGHYAVVRCDNEKDSTRVEAGAAPTWSSTDAEHVRRFIHRVVSKPTGTQVEIEPPLMLDFTNYNPEIVAGDSSTSTILSYFGLEGISFEDYDPGTETWRYGIRAGRLAYSWFYDVDFLYKDEIGNGQGLDLENSYRAEVRKCRFRGDPSNGAASFSDGGLEINWLTSCLIEDNIFDTPRAVDSFGWDVGIYSDGYINNCVFSYNFFEQTHKCFLVAHTSGYDILNLFEGNVGPRMQEDGYYYSSQNNTVYRNWWRGRNASGDAHPSGGYASWFKRFARDWSLVGNVWGWDGTSSSSSPQYGYPNTGNDTFSGTAQPTLSDFWADWADYVAGTYLSGTNGFQEIDLDVEASFEIVHNYESANPGPGAVADSTADTLPASLAYAAEPSWWGDDGFIGSWPAINPDSPGFDNDAIPAGARWAGTTGPVVSGAAYGGRLRFNGTGSKPVLTDGTGSVPIKTN